MRLYDVFFAAKANFFFPLLGLVGLVFVVVFVVIVEMKE